MGIRTSGLYADVLSLSEIFMYKQHPLPTPTAPPLHCQFAEHGSCPGRSGGGWSFSHLAASSGGAGEAHRDLMRSGCRGVASQPPSLWLGPFSSNVIPQDSQSACQCLILVPKG